MNDGYSIMKILSKDVPDKHINRENITDEKTAEFIERYDAIVINHGIQSMEQ